MIKIVNILKLAFLGIGLGVFVQLLRELDWTALSRIFAALSGWGLLYLAVYPLESVINALGWKWSFPKEAQDKVRLGRLYSIRLAGQALNTVTPFLDIGGEIAKVSMVADKLGIRKNEAAASVVLARSLLFFSEILFWCLGLSMAFIVLPLDAAWRTWALLPLVLCAAAGIGIYKIESGGCMIPRALRLKHRFVQNLSSFYGDTGRFASLLALHFLGWMVGALEMGIILQLLGAPVSFGTALMLEALLHFARTAFFFIPLQIGAQEAVFAMAGHALGFGPLVGISVSLLKRFRQIVWTAVGLGVWFYMDGIEKSARKFLLDCDTPIDFLIHRKPAKILASFLAKFPVHPNGVTLASLLAAFASAFCFAAGRADAALCAVFFFYLWSVLDNTDGELARMTGQTSEFGKWLDDFCDALSSTVVLGGIFMGALILIPVESRAFYACLFIPALFLNGYFGTRLSVTKQNLRRRYLDEGIVNRGFSKGQKTLDRFTGREPFYALLAFSVFAFFQGGGWAYVLLHLVIAGCAVFGLGYGICDWRLRMSSAAGVPGSRLSPVPAYRASSSTEY